MKLIDNLLLLLLTNIYEIFLDYILLVGYNME